MEIIRNELKLNLEQRLWFTSPSSPVEINWSAPCSDAFISSLDRNQPQRPRLQLPELAAATADVVARGTTQCLWSPHNFGNGRPWQHRWGGYEVWNSYAIISLSFSVTKGNRVDAGGCSSGKIPAWAWWATCFGGSSSLQSLYVWWVFTAWYFTPPSHRVYCYRKVLWTINISESI